MVNIINSHNCEILVCFILCISFLNIKESLYEHCVNTVGADVESDNVDG